MIRHYVNGEDYRIVLTLVRYWQDWNKHTLTPLGFPNWVMLQYKASIVYHYNSTAIWYFSFQTENDLTWFLLHI